MISIKFSILLALCLIGIASQSELNTAFSRIYEQHAWGSGETPASGQGSNPCKGIKYLIYLQHLIDQNDIYKIV